MWETVCCVDGPGLTQGSHHWRSVQPLLLGGRDRAPRGEQGKECAVFSLDLSGVKVAMQEPRAPSALQTLGLQGGLQVCDEQLGLWERGVGTVTPAPVMRARCWVRCPTCVIDARGINAPYVGHAEGRDGLGARRGAMGQER